MAITGVQLVDPKCEVTDSDYNTIESAIMESSRGRWFLSEYARRNRHADTNLLLSAIYNIKETLDGTKRTSRPYRVSQAVPNVADTCCNDKPDDSDLHGSGSRYDEKEVFVSRY